MELYVNPQCSEEIINISKSFGVDAKIIGRVEDSSIKKLSIITDNGSFFY
jgi:phosphoribosylformylglycinamidine cyclo-ligase